MSWKKAVFFGGAVLVLAACDNATAPTSPSALTRLDRGAVSVVKKSGTTTTADTTAVPTGGVNTECASAVIHVGLDGELIVTCVPSINW